MSSKRNQPFLPIGGTADELEHAFYEALQKADLDALMACWADEEEIFCVHPGGPRLVGAMAIRNAFEQMFSNGAIHALPARVRKVESAGASVHNVLERIELLTVEGLQHAYVLATNVYVRTPQGWRLAAHHASPASALPPDPAESEPQVLH